MNAPPDIGLGRLISAESSTRWENWLFFLYRSLIEKEIVDASVPSFHQAGCEIFTPTLAKRLPLSEKWIDQKPLNRKKVCGEEVNYFPLRGESFCCFRKNRRFTGDERMKEKFVPLCWKFFFVMSGEKFPPQNSFNFGNWKLMTLNCF